MKIRRTTNVIILFCSILVFINTGMRVLSAEADKEIVRVGYFDLGDYYTVQADGSVDSYDSAYLEQIENYTNYEFVYVDCGTWEGALQMLKRHEIDLVGTMQWTRDRETRYEICDASYGYSVAELAAPADSDYIYEDYEGISGTKVGYIGGYVIANQLHELMAEHDFTVNLQSYSNQTELDQALEDGEIDLIASNAHAMHDDWRIIERFSYAPFYFASWYGNNELTENISEAIIQISIHIPDFNDELIRQYFPRLVTSPYNKEEMECIDQSKDYKVYMDGSTPPLSWYDEDSGNMKGVLVDICKQLQALTGIQLSIEKRDETELYSDSSAVSYRTLYYDMDQNASCEEGATEAILDQNFELYHCVGDSFDPMGTYRIAIVTNRDGLKAYLRDTYPNCTLVEYFTPEECLLQMRDGTTDLAYLNSYVAEHVIIQDSLDEITAIPMTDSTFGIALQFHGEDAELLAGIIDKGIKLLDDKAVNDSMVQYALATTPEITFTYIIRRHLGLAVAVIIVLILLIIAFSVLITYARVMRKQRNQVEAADRERTDFFARMSHDMRTPMNGILGMIELTEQTCDIAEVHDNMAKAKSSGQYMLSLINDTLDLQRLESGKLKFNLQIIRLGAFLENISEMIRTTAQQKQLDLQIHSEGIERDIYLRLDPIRVKQILANLLSNAIKFTPEGGRIKFSSACTCGENKLVHLCFHISDTGVGMSQEFISKQLYRAYSQEHNRISDSYAGSGLGLAITKNLVDMMDGRIEVHSETGEGTTFTVQLDFERVNSEKAVQEQRRAQMRENHVQIELQGKKILLCEDHPLNAEITMRLLEKVGCQSTWAEDGKKGLELFRASELHFFDAILMDIRMPVMDGIETAKQIRALEREDAKQVPILALSANAYDDDIRSCIAAGMNDHISKPVEPVTLYETLTKYV